MTIDDPVRVEIHQAREELEARSYLPSRAVQLGMSAVAAAAFAKLPFFSQIFTALLMSSSSKIETRFLDVAEALENQLQLIEHKIHDKNYYESDEFQTLLVLIIEKLQSTHQKEKLRIFGESLANCGHIDFVADDKEDYIRTLRDMSLEDIQALRKAAEFNKLPSHLRGKGFLKSENPSFSRLSSLGLIHESVGLRELNLSIPSVPQSRQSPEGYTRALANAFEQYFKKGPLVTYRLSVFGSRFLDFISTASTEGTVKA
jgi:hypothetical protein